MWPVHPAESSFSSWTYWTGEVIRKEFSQLLEGAGPQGEEEMIDMREEKIGICRAVGCVGFLAEYLVEGRQSVGS